MYPQYMFLITIREISKIELRHEKTGFLSGADQLRSKCETDQRLCFRHLDSNIFSSPKSKISSFNHLLRLYRPVCPGPGQNSRRQVFSRRGSIF